MRRIIYALLLLLVFCVFPAVALANAPEPDPNDFDVLIDDDTNIEEYTLYGFDTDGNRHNITSITTAEQTRVHTERIVNFYNRDAKYTHIQLSITFKTGDIVHSNKVLLEKWSNYSYSVETNELKPCGPFASRKLDGMTLGIGFFVLILPLGFTLILEWGVALIFKVKPAKYVIFVNLVTNVAMNIIIVQAVNHIPSYLLLVLILELCVIGIEYLAYLDLYREYNKVKLLYFSIVANAVSWGAYAIFCFYFM